MALAVWTGVAVPRGMIDVGEQLTYNASYTNGTSSGLNVITSGGLVTGKFTVTAPDGTFLDGVDLR